MEDSAMRYIGIKSSRHSSPPTLPPAGNVGDFLPKSRPVTSIFRVFFFLRDHSKLMSAGHFSWECGWSWRSWKFEVMSVSSHKISVLYSTGIKMSRRRWSKNSEKSKCPRTLILNDHSLSAQIKLKFPKIWTQKKHTEHERDVKHGVFERGTPLSFLVFHGFYRHFSRFSFVLALASLVFWYVRLIVYTIWA